MKNKIIIILVLISVLSVSCATSKKQVQKSKKETQVIKAQDISEDEKNKFEYTFIEAIKQKMIGNQAAAITLFSECLEINPNSSSAMFELAKIYSTNGDQTSASLLLEKAINLEPDNKWYKVLLAQIYQQGKQYEKAAHIYGELYKKDPENLEYLYMNAALLNSAGKHELSIQAYDQLEKKIGVIDQISVEKHQIYLEEGKKKEALAELEKLIKSNPKEPRFYGLLADYYLSEKDEVNALKNYNKVLEIDPDNGFVMFSLASYYKQKNDKVKAWEYVQKGFGNKEVEVETKIQYYLMMASDTANAFFTDDQVAQLVELLMKTNSDDNRVYTVYAEHLIRQGKLKEAREQLRKVIDMDKNNYLIWERMLMLSNELLDFNSIYADATEALELFPNQPILYALKAVACLQLQKYSEVVSTLDEGDAYVLDNKPLKIQFDMYRAEANYKMDKVQEAFKAFEEVIKLDPENWMAMNNYAYYLSLRNEELEKAELLSGRAVKANPENPTYLDTYAWVLFMRKDYTLAKFYMEIALKNGGDKNGTLLEHYGDILYMLGEKDKAMEQWQKAVVLGETSELLNQKIKQQRYLDK